MCIRDSLCSMLNFAIMQLQTQMWHKGQKLLAQQINGHLHQRCRLSDSFAQLLWNYCLSFKLPLLAFIIVNCLLKQSNLLQHLLLGSKRVKAAVTKKTKFPKRILSTIFYDNKRHKKLMIFTFCKHFLESRPDSYRVGSLPEHQIDLLSEEQKGCLFWNEIWFSFTWQLNI